MKFYYVRSDGKAFCHDTDSPYCVVAATQYNSDHNGFSLHSKKYEFLSAQISLECTSWTQVTKKEAYRLIGRTVRPKNYSGVSKKLIRSIEKIESEAANYLRGEKIVSLTSFKPIKTNYKKTRTLSELFIWSESPQGHSYWSNIEEK